MGLLYGAPTNVPSPTMDWLKAPGCGYVQNRTIAANASWLVAGRAAGMESLYYANLMEHPTQWTPSDEEAFLYPFGSYSNVPSAYWWTGNAATSGNRVNYAGQRMLNIRPGSVWWQHVLDWVVDFWTRQNGRFDGFFLDVLGNRLWVSVWNTMAATTDAVAGDGRAEAENWIRGVHWGLTQMRAALGPQVIIVANNTYEETGLGLSGGKALSAITGGYPSMQKGGHPALNGCMFEGCDGGATTGQHPVSRVTADIAGSVTAGSPHGKEWATSAGGRKRFMAISSKSSANMAAYAGVPNLWVGWMPSGYENKAQSQVSGTTKTAWDDHLAGWTFTGSTPDTSPPLAHTALNAGPSSGSSVPVTWTLPSDTDRANFTIARKATAWTAGQTHTAGTTVYSTSPGAAGAGSTTLTGQPDGTWYYKGFTIDAVGNEQTTGPSAAPVTVAAGGGVDTTPPLAPTAFAAGAASGSSVPFTWTLPTDADRASFSISRKATAWSSGQGPSAGTTIYTATPGAAGAGSTTVAGLPDGTWYFKAFTTDAVGNIQPGGPSSGPVTIAAAQGPARTYVDDSFVGAAASKPDPSTWTDPDTASANLTAGSTMRLDGSGELRITAKAATDGVYGGVAVQYRDRITWASARPKRALLVEMGGSGGTNGSTSFYLVGPSGAETGDGLTWSTLFPYPDWLRFEHINSTFTITRKTAGASTVLYTGAAPAGLYEVWLLIDTDTLKVRVNGVDVVDLSPWVAEFSTPFDEAHLYLEAASDDNPTGWTARFGSFRFMRATPSEPGDTEVVVSPGVTAYTSPDPPAEELVDTWHYFVDAVEVATSSTPDTTGPELAPGTYDIGVQTENASPFVEV